MYSDMECVMITTIMTGYGDLWFTESKREKEPHSTLYRGEYFALVRNHKTKLLWASAYFMYTIRHSINPMCLSRSRGRLSTFIIIWYGVPKSSGYIPFPRFDHRAIRYHTRFAHKILHYNIIIWCICPSAVISYCDRVFSIFRAVFQLHTRLLLRNVTTPAD